MNVLDEFKNYKRKFIQISPRTAILLHIFSKDSDDFEDIVLLDNEGYRENKLFKSNYKLAISELENKILEKEMELENFFNNDNISKSKNSYTVSLFGSYYDRNLFKRYYDLKQDLIRYYDLLQEYKTTYDNFILGLENESNSNQ